ncbi:helix-turn-helix transcriptional regulator [Glycomyces tritici]|uniref:Helix-turn-helix transcriptional regulator n=1 Tax=Glycomyces tritici TaxID=2665176 RepID=A0ABT7YLR1_9ACTN|nr:helix-turn-helix transcriptional regulator [Glycomyces tritici]MDN3239223.1 helix-turn-helix transcriptional regulator [Glycomyces tritici]
MEKTPFKVTPATLDVLEVLLSGDDELYSLKIAKAIKRPAGSVTPILMRLERCEWVTSRWEDDGGERRGPRRRFYEIDPNHLAAARDLVASRRRATNPGFGLGQPGLAGA